MHSFPPNRDRNGPPSQKATPLKARAETVRTRRSRCIILCPTNSPADFVGKRTQEARKWRTENDTTTWDETPPATRRHLPRITIEADVPDYDFDIWPDSQCQLSTPSFNPDYKRLFRRYMYVPNGRVIYPYFTIEFKKDDNTIEPGRNQVGVVVALALFVLLLIQSCTAHLPFSSEYNFQVRNSVGPGRFFTS